MIIDTSRPNEQRKQPRATTLITTTKHKEYRKTTKHFTTTNPQLRAVNERVRVPQAIPLLHLESKLYINMIGLGKIKDEINDNQIQNSNKFKLK